MKSDVVIIGGGIIGLYNAYILSNYDLDITIIDKGDIGQACSSAAGGILSLLPPWSYDNTFNFLTKQANSAYADLAKVLENSCNVDIEYWPCGLINLNIDDYQTAVNWCQTNNVNYQSPPITNKKISVIDKHTTIFLPDVTQLQSTKLISALITYLKSKGIKFYTKTKVNACKISNQRIYAVDSSQGLIKTNTLIWATGAWASQLELDNKDHPTPMIKPIRGQMIAYQANDIDLKHIILSEGHYLIPRKDGTILAGSTLEDVGFDNSSTEEAGIMLHNKSVNLIPSLSKLKIIRHWAGLRPFATNNLPIIGPHPSIKGIYLNCGHYRYGITMAPTSAGLISKFILDPNQAISEEIVPLQLKSTG